MRAYGILTGPLPRKISMALNIPTPHSLGIDMVIFMRCFVAINRLRSDWLTLVFPRKISMALNIPTPHSLGIDMVIFMRCFVAINRLRSDWLTLVFP